MKVKLHSFQILSLDRDEGPFPSSGHVSLEERTGGPNGVNGPENRFVCREEEQVPIFETHSEGQPKFTTVLKLVLIKRDCVERIWTSGRL